MPSSPYPQRINKLKIIKDELLSGLYILVPICFHFLPPIIAFFGLENKWWTLAFAVPILSLAQLMGAGHDLHLFYNSF